MPGSGGVRSWVGCQCAGVYLFQWIVAMSAILFATWSVDSVVWRVV